MVPDKEQSSGFPDSGSVRMIVGYGSRGGWRRSTEDPGPLCEPAGKRAPMFGRRHPPSFSVPPSWGGGDGDVWPQGTGRHRRPDKTKGGRTRGTVSGVLWLERLRHHSLTVGWTCTVVQ